MRDKLKKLFLNFKKVKEPSVLATCPVAKRSLWFGVVFSLVFLGIALPSQLVQAGFLDVLASIPVMIITLLLQVVLSISEIILGLTGAILGWVTGPHFTTLPYTHGGIVDVGWPIVRDFINMFFIIALVVIGLATSLRIKEYQFQKTLPTLIMIAILINFTPVICGLIIDASNILMNFFLEELTGFQLMIKFFNMQNSAVWEALSHPFSLSYASAALGKTIVMLVFSLGIPKVFWGAAYIFFMFSLLFITRYVMLWALVIVSPIAFFSRIFPGSQKYLFKSILGWDEWWKEFIEWSLVGVIAGFFLYLGEQLMVKAPTLISGLPPGQGGGGWSVIVDFVNNFLPWMVVLVFLWLGYKITKEISAMGAQGVMKAADTAVKLVATSALAAATMGAGAAAGAGLLGKAAIGASRAEAFLGKRGFTKPLQYLVGKPAKWATRGVEMAAAPRLLQYAAKTRRVNYDEIFKGMDAGEMAQIIMQMPTKARRVGGAAWMAEKGFLDKVPGKSVPVLDKDDNPVPLLDEKGKQIIDSETGKPLFKTKMTSPFHDQMAKEATDLAEKPEYKKNATDVLETLAGKITEKVSLNLETDPTAKAKLKIEIGKIAEEISKDKEIKVEIEARAAEEKISFEQAARDMASREIWAAGIKGGDVKDVAKSSFDDVGVRRGTWMWHSGQWQALMNNFKKPVVDKTLNGPGGMNYMFRKEGEVFLEHLDDKNQRGINFFSLTPAGREWNWEGLKYMPAGLDVFRKEKEVGQMAAGPAKTAAEINIMTEKLNGLRKRSTRTPVEEQEITRLEKEIENKSITLGIAAKPGTEEHMVEQVNLMTARIRRLKKQTARATAEEDEIRMLETTIADIWKRLDRTPPPPPGTPRPPRGGKRPPWRPGPTIPPSPEAPRPPRGGKGPPSRSGPAISVSPPPPKKEGLTPEELATETIKAALEETRRTRKPKVRYQTEEIYPVEVLERQVREHLERVRKAGGIPLHHQPFLTAYLRQKGVSKEEIDKMTAKEAWAKAEEILRELRK